MFASVGYFSVFLFFLFLFHSPLFLCATLLPPDYGSPLKIYIKSTTPFRSHFHQPSASCRGNSWFSLYSERVGHWFTGARLLVLFPHHLENPSSLLHKIAQLPSVLLLVIREEFSVEWVKVGLILRVVTSKIYKCQALALGVSLVIAILLQFGTLKGLLYSENVHKP